MSHTIIWLIVAVVCGIIEVLTMGLWFLWMALAALVVALGIKLGVLTSWGPEAVAFGVLSILLMIFTRPLLVQALQTRETKSNVDSMIGKVAVVIKDITPLETGQIKLYGDIWTAVSNQNIPEGTRVVIRSIEGVKLHVELVQE
ncbi:MAG: NfeD family protein [Candidatus Saccharibacteria bacterium]